MAATSVGSARFTAAQPDLWYRPRIWAALYPLVVFQTGGTDTAATTGMTGARPSLDALVTQGFSVVMPAAGSWGNATAMTRMSDAITWGRANLPCTTDPPVVIGISNGGVATLQYARQNDVTAAVTFIAPLDLNYLRDNDIASTRAGIDTAFGVTWSSPGVEALPAHADLLTDSDSYVGLPLQMWTSSDDPLNNPAATQASWAASVGADWHNLGAVGHSYASMNGVDPAAVVAFIEART